MANKLKKIIVILFSLLVAFSSISCVKIEKGSSSAEDPSLIEKSVNEKPDDSKSKDENKSSQSKDNQEKSDKDKKNQNTDSKENKQNKQENKIGDQTDPNENGNLGQNESQNEKAGKVDNPDPEQGSEINIDPSDPTIIGESSIPMINTRLLLRQLDTDELKFCEIIYQGLLNHNLSINVPNDIKLTFKRTSELIEGIFYDCPELLMCEGSYDLFGSPYTSRVAFKYALTKQAYESQMKEINAVVEQMIKATKNMDAYNKELYVHDKICDKTTFSLDAKYAETAYGALITGKAICQGYAKGFQLVMQNLGYPCSFVSSDNLGHGWNLVQIGNKCYQIDLTWDDDDDINSYAFFNLTDTQMAVIGHSYDHLASWTYPPASSIDKNYYYKNGLYLSRGADIKQIFFNEIEKIYAKGGGVVKLMFESSEDLDTLISNHHAWLEEWNEWKCVNISTSRTQFENTNLVYYTNFEFSETPFD